MLSKEISLRLLKFVNDAEFCAAWESYIQELIKTKELDIRRYNYGDNNIYTTVSQLKLLEEFARMPERVRGAVK